MFENIKVGDKVIYNLNQNLSIEVVERLTKTRVIVNGSSFNRKNGERIGASTWTRTLIRIEPYNETLAKKIDLNLKRKMLINQIRQTELGKLPVSKLQKIYDFIKEFVCE